MTQPISDDVVARMVALTRRLVERGTPHYDFLETLDEARAIAALLPELVDLDREEAIAIYRSALNKSSTWQEEIFLAIRRGRELAGQGK